MSKNYQKRQILSILLFIDRCQSQGARFPLLTNKTSKTMRLLYCILFIICINCGDGLKYQEENYVSFESMDDMVFQIVDCIKNEDPQVLLELLNNDLLILDLLNQSTGKDALKTKAYMGTKEGKLNYSREQMSKKERIRVFFSKGLKQQLELNTAFFRSTGFEFISDAIYAEGVNAKIQQYRIRLDNGDDKQYTYDIEVIFCEGKYHLIEAAGYLDSPS